MTPDVKKIRAALTRGSLVPLSDLALTEEQESMVLSAIANGAELCCEREMALDLVDGDPVIADALRSWLYDQTGHGDNSDYWRDMWIDRVIASLAGVVSPRGGG